MFTRVTEMPFVPRERAPLAATTAKSRAPAPGFHFAVLCQTVSVVRHSRPERPEASVVEEFPSRQCTEATLRACALSALPSAIRDVTRTTATKTVERPITTRRNQRERAQGSTTRISTPQAVIFI